MPFENTAADAAISTSSAKPLTAILKTGVWPVPQEQAATGTAETRMSVPLRIRRIQVFPLAIPMRFRFEHAAAGRDVADPVVLQIEGAAPFADRVGHGETLARPYVTGETADTVVADIAAVFAARLLDFRPTTFAEALEFIDTLPTTDGDRLVLAARAAVELALLDLAGQVFRRRAADLAGWLGAPGFGPPGALRSASYSGIIVGRNPRKLAWALRAQRCYGLRDFKIKVAVDGWQDRLQRATSSSAAPRRRPRSPSRANRGGWTVSETLAAAPTLAQFGVTALEQPLPIRRLPAPRPRKIPCDLIADESLRTMDDARRLIAAGGPHPQHPHRQKRRPDPPPSASPAPASPPASTSAPAASSAKPRIHRRRHRLPRSLPPRPLRRRALRYVSAEGRQSPPQSASRRSGRIAARPGFGLGIRSTTPPPRPSLPTRPVRSRCDTPRSAPPPAKRRAFTDFGRYDAGESRQNHVPPGPDRRNEARVPRQRPRLHPHRAPRRRRHVPCSSPCSSPPSAARKQAKQVVCLANQKTIALAVQQYAHDNNAIVGSYNDSRGWVDWPLR